MEALPLVSQTLKFAFDRKKRLNPRATVRWLAKQLSISPGMMSMILKGDRLPSLKILSELCRILDIDLEKEDQIRKHILENKNKSVNISDIAFSKSSDKKNKPQDWHNVDETQFVAIQDWYYFAIMQAMLLKNYDGGLSFISNFLGLSHDIVVKAVDELVLAGLVERDSETGFFKKVHQYSEFTSRHRKKLTGHHIKNMTKVIDILENRSTPYNEANRLVTSSCFTCKAEDIPLIKQKITDLLKDIASTDSSQGHEEICFLLAQFVPLSNQ